MARRTGQSPAEIIKTGIELYDEQLKEERSAARAEKRLEELIIDPEKRRIYHEVMSALGKRSSEKLTTEQRSERARAAGLARGKSLSSSRRKEVARKAAKARWSKESPE